jgi:hypothetical protein
MHHPHRIAIRRLYAIADPCFVAIGGLLVAATLLAILSLAFQKKPLIGQMNADQKMR